MHYRSDRLIYLLKHFHTCEQIDGVNPQAVTMTQFLSLPPVEGDPRPVPAVRAHGDLELYPGKNHDRTE